MTFVGPSLKSKTLDHPKSDTVVGCHRLNSCTALGMSVSVKVA